MFGTLQPTPFDVCFRVGSTNVRVHPFFWLFSILSAIDSSKLFPPELRVLWIILSTGAVFISILIHELGHAWMIRLFGGHSQITLHSFGGYATVEGLRNHTWFKQVLISFAGPLAGFILYGGSLLIVFGSMLQNWQLPTGIFLFLSMLIYINLWWGLLNLLPVYPLDGGQICRAVLLRFFGHRGSLWTLQISIFTAGAATAWFLYQHRTLSFPVILFGLLFLENIQSSASSR